MSTTAVPLRPVKRSWIVWLLAAIALAAVGGMGLAWAGTANSIDSDAAFFARQKVQSGIVTTPSGLQYQVLKKGEGPTPTLQDIALINYSGTLRDGTEFDQAKRAPLPVGGVVPGFSEALMLMPRGSSYRVWIPSGLGYGAKAAGDAIPANSMLIFDIDMIDFRSQAEIQAQMQAMQAQQAPQGQLPAGPQGAPPPGMVPPR